MPELWRTDGAGMNSVGKVFNAAYDRGIEDAIGKAAMRSRNPLSDINYGHSDRVDEMVLLYGILKELREINARALADDS